MFFIKRIFYAVYNHLVHLNKNKFILYKLLTIDIDLKTRLRRIWDYLKGEGGWDRKTHDEYMKVIRSIVNGQNPPSKKK